MTKPKTLREEIAGMIAEKPGITRAGIQGWFDRETDLADEFDAEPKRIAKTLSNMVQSGQVYRDDKMGYTLAKRQVSTQTSTGKAPPPGASEQPAPDPIGEELFEAVEHTRRACQRYIDSLNDPVLNELLEACRHADAEEEKFRSMAGG